MEERNYYENIPDDEFVPLTCVDNLIGSYEINKLGHIRYKDTNKIKKIHPINKDGYPKVYLEGGKRSFRIHILLAKTFIPNPDNKPIVDHINRNKSDYSLDNLRWATPLENNLNKDKQKPKEVIFVKLDDNGNPIEEFSIYDFSESIRGSINESIRNSSKYKGFYWKRIDLVIEDYISRFGEPLDSDWKQCLRFPELECNKNGLIRKQSNKKYMLGCINEWGYRTLNYKGHCYQFHRLIYETFSGDILTDKDQIDHISTIKDDNRFINLRKCSPSENMNNPLTLIHKSKIVELYSITGELLESFNNSHDAAVKFDLKDYNIYFYSKHGNITKYGIFSYRNDYEKLKESLNSIIYKYDSSGNFIKCYIYLKDAEKDTTVRYSSISRSIEKNIICKDGFYYSRGPRNFDKEDV